MGKITIYRIYSEFSIVFPWNSWWIFPVRESLPGRVSLHLPRLNQAFFPALFEQGGAELAMARAVGEVFGGQALDTSTDISSVLRGLLASDLPEDPSEMADMGGMVP